MIVALSLLACFSTKVWQDVNVDTEGSQPALMVNASVYVSDMEEDSVVGAVMDVVQNQTLPEVGAALPGKVAGALEGFGFQLVVDGDRVKKSGTMDFTEFSNDFTVLSGAYYHPEAITMPLTWATLNRKRASARIAEALDDPNATDAYLYIDMAIIERTRFLVMKETLVQLSLLVVDEQGEDLLRARAYGEGGMSPLVADRSPSVVLGALDAAILDLQATPPLITTAELPETGSFVRVAER